MVPSMTTQSKKSKNNQTGAFGEQTVVNYLLEHNIEVVDRNWRIREGEIDIVARHESGTYAFVEVKTRSSLAFGHPLESISREKAYRLQRLSLAWLAINHAISEPFTIDCAAVLISPTGQGIIEYRAGVL
jgi:putative endonuclease